MFDALGPQNPYSISLLRIDYDGEGGSFPFLLPINICESIADGASQDLRHRNFLEGKPHPCRG